MKKLFLLAFAAGLFAACNNNSATNEDSTAVPTEAPATMEETAPLPDTTMATDSMNLNNPGAPNPAPTPGTDSATGPR